uniref:Trigger factor n=1 Tax=Ammonifex degensii TaxID=42838 RepID=A0A7C1FCP0_9THEO
MRATAEKLASGVVVLEVEVEAERFSQAVERACRKLAKDVVVPGFRKGRVPRVILERYLGKETLYNEALTLVMGEAYPAAVQDTGIEPVAQPEVEVVQAEEGKPLVFKAKVEVKPEVELGQYRGLEVTRKVKPITPADIEAELERLRQRYARLTTLEDGTVMVGDIVKIDYKGSVNGKGFKGGAAKGKEVEVGRGYLVPALDEALIGMRVGETKEVKFTLPNDYHDERVAGKEAIFTVTVRETRRKELMPLGDDFAKEVSEFDTLEELKADIARRLEEAAASEADLLLRQEVVAQAVANANAEPPPSMVKRQVEEMLEDMIATVEGRGVSRDRFFEIMNTTPEEMRERLSADAVRTLKTRLVLDAVAKAEALQVSEAEIEAELKKLATLYRQEPQELRKMFEATGRLAVIRQKLLRDKTVEFLVEQAIIKEELPEIGGVTAAPEAATEEGRAQGEA